MKIETLEALHNLYASPSERAVKKELTQLDPHCTRFIALSPFVVLASSNIDFNMDASPRGGDPGFVKVQGPNTLIIPDSPGNNRLDTFENIIQTGRVGLLFLVPGVDESLRVNGTACLSTLDADLSACSDATRRPKLAIRVTVEAAYLHCAKALMRSALWDSTKHLERSHLPSLGEMLKDQLRSDTPAATQAEMLAYYKSSL